MIRQLVLFKQKTISYGKGCAGLKSEMAIRFAADY